MSARMFLLLAAGGLAPIALSYGVQPEKTLEFLFGLQVKGVNGAHVFRGVMGLYFALAGFWVAGAFKQNLTRPALYSLIVFMLGLAAGRLLSLVVDGMPHWLLLVYLLLELFFGVLGTIVLRKLPADGGKPSED